MTNPPKRIWKLHSNEFIMVFMPIEFVFVLPSILTALENLCLGFKVCCTNEVFAAAADTALTAPSSLPFQQLILTKILVGQVMMQKDFVITAQTVFCIRMLAGEIGTILIWEVNILKDWKHSCHLSLIFSKTSFRHEVVQCSVQSKHLFCWSYCDPIYIIIGVESEMGTQCESECCPSGSL